MPFTSPGPRVRAAVLRGVAAVAVLAALVGCAGKVDTGAASEDDRYISGDGSSTLFPAAEREPAPGSRARHWTAIRSASPTTPATSWW